MSIPDEAVEEAAGWLPHAEDCEVRPERDCTCWLPRTKLMRAALEAAAPIMLSHELEQTRLAHLDAVVNAQGLADAWEAGMRHALAWLGLRHYGDVMAKDNPHKGAEG